MKDKKILSLFILVLLGLLVLGCSGYIVINEEEVEFKEDKGPEEKVPSSITIQEEEKPSKFIKKEDKIQITEKQIKSFSIKGQEKEVQEKEILEDASQGQRIGSKEYGFISVPQDWNEFIDLDENTSIQYSNILGTSIVSLNVFDLSTVPEDLLDDFDLEMAATSVWHNLDAGGVEDIEAGHTVLDGRPAIQICGRFISQDHKLPSMICAWMVEADDGNYHYLAVEAAQEDFVPVYLLVENTYSLDE